MKESSRFDSPQKMKEELPQSPLSRKKTSFIEDSIKPRKTFKIRPQKTFFFEPELKSSRLSQSPAKHNSRISPSSEITKIKNKSKPKNFQTQNDLAEIEKSIIMKLQKKRRKYLWEARRQDYEETKKKLQNRDKVIENSIFSKDFLDNQNESLNSPADNFLSNWASHDLKKNLTNNENSPNTNTENSSQNFLKNNDNNESNKDIQLPLYKSSTFVKKTDKKLNFNQNYFKTDLPFGKTQLMQMYHLKIKKLCMNEMLRKINRKNLVFDSQEESESDEDSEIEGSIINPETKFIFVFDSLLLAGSIYYLFYVTLSSAIVHNFCNCNKNLFLLFLNTFFELVYIFDFTFSFFRGYYSQAGEFSQSKKKLIKNNKKILINYISGWFLFDLCSSIPIYLIGFCKCKKLHSSFDLSFADQKNNVLFKSLCYMKFIKIFKLFQSNKNKLYSKLVDYLSKFEFFDNKLDLFKKLILSLISLHSMSCIYIFIGRHNYPSWIIKNGFINYSFTELYISAFYYLLATMTTVGYGDVIFGANAELIYRTFLLTVGIIAYSYIITSISNTITKASYASMNYDKEAKILEDIRMSHPQLPFSTYLKIKKYLELKNFRQQSKDKNILIDNIPFTLKNDLILAMYNKQINNFHFFKGVSNTNFLVEVLTNFTQTIAIKNDILIKEDDIINEVFFVKEGKLSLEVSIDLNNRENSKNKYLSDDYLNYLSDHEEDNKPKIFTQSIDINDKSELSNRRISINNINRISTSFFRSQNPLLIENDKSEIFLKVHEVHRNDDYGSLFLFLDKKSPFNLRVRSKNADLFVLKKTNMNKILNNYKNIWRNIINAKKRNMSGIKKKIIKIVLDYFDMNAIKTNDTYPSSVNFSPISSPNNNKEKNRLFYQLMKKKSIKKSNLAQSAINSNIKESEDAPEIERVRTKSDKDLLSYIKMKTIVFEEDEENCSSEKEKTGNEKSEKSPTNTNEIKNELDSSNKTGKSKSTNGKKNKNKHFHNSVIDNKNISGIISNFKNNSNNLTNMEMSQIDNDLKNTTTIKSGMKLFQSEIKNSFLLSKINFESHSRFKKGMSSFVANEELRKKYSLSGTAVGNMLKSRLKTAKKKNEKKIIIKTNVVLDKKFENEHCFDYTDSEDSIATEIIGDKNNIEPITLKQLPESLSYFIKREMKVDDLTKKNSKFALMLTEDSNNMSVKNHKGKNYSVIYNPKKNPFNDKNKLDNNNLTFIINSKNKNLVNQENDKKIILPSNEDNQKNNIKIIDSKNVQTNFNQNEGNIIFYKQFFFDAKELSQSSNESFSIIDKSTDYDYNENKQKNNNNNNILKKSFDNNYLKVEHVLAYAHLNENYSISNNNTNINYRKDLNSKKKKNKIKGKTKSTRKGESSSDNTVNKSPPIFKFEFYGQNNILQNYNLIERKLSKGNKQNKHKSEKNLRNQIIPIKTDTAIENFRNSNKKENHNLVEESPQNKIKFVDGKIISYSTSNKFDILFDTKKK